MSQEPQLNVRTDQAQRQLEPESFCQWGTWGSSSGLVQNHILDKTTQKKGRRQTDTWEAAAMVELSGKDDSEKGNQCQLRVW